MFHFFASHPWVELEYPDGQKQTVKGFAMAWTPDAVYAQWVEFSRAREAWVRPNQCRRREIPVKDSFQYLSVKSLCMATARSR